jgi:hypothetical protein
VARLTVEELVALGQVELVREANVTVGTSVTELARPNARRVQVSFTNQGANDVRVTREGLPTATFGLPLDAAGGFIVDRAAGLNGIGRACQGQYRAVAINDPSVVTVLEYQVYLLPGQELA